MPPLKPSDAPSDPFSLAPVLIAELPHGSGGAKEYPRFSETISWEPLRETMSGRPSPLTSTSSWLGSDVPLPSPPVRPRSTIWLPVVLLLGGAELPEASTVPSPSTLKEAGLPPTPTLSAVASPSRGLPSPGTDRLFDSRPPVGVVYCTWPLATTSGKPSPFRSR